MISYQKVKSSSYNYNLFASIAYFGINLAEEELDRRR